MDVRPIQELALTRGVTLQGLDEVVARVQHHFGDQTPSPQALGAFINGLDVWDKIGMEKQAFLGMPADWRMTQARAFVPPTPMHPRRPIQDFRPNEEQQAELDALATSADKMTRYRAMRDQAAQTPAPGDAS